MQEFPYGTVVTLRDEDTAAEIRRTLAAIKGSGMNTVVVWPAVDHGREATAAAEPFARVRSLLDDAQELGLEVIVELIGQIPTLEYLPASVMKEEYYAVERDGSPRRLPRPYDFVNFNHPEVKELISAYLRVCVLAYRDKPALAGYDIWNETMFSSFDRYTLAAFQDWLEGRYRRIEVLNRSWQQHFTSWRQIEFSEWIWASVMPVVDYMRFSRFNVAQLLREWRAIVRRHDPQRPCIADNIHSMVTTDAHYERPQDDWSVAREVDEFGISFYPKNQLPEMHHATRWEVFSATRAAAPSGRFWVSELQSHNQSMFNPFNVVRPHDLHWWNWEAVAHGAKGIVYWKWRPFTRGLQTGARGLVDASGASTPRSEAAAHIAGVLSDHAALFAAARPRRARCAILYDSLSHDLVKAFVRNYELPGSLYTDSIAGLYRALWDRNLAVDFLTPEELESGGGVGYRVLFLSNQVRLGAALASALATWVESGGIVVADGKFGLTDDEGALYDELPGGPLNALLGYRVRDVDPEGMAFSTEGGEWEGISLTGSYERSLLAVEGARVIARFGDGLPAMVCSPHGRGEFLSIASHLWQGYPGEAANARLVELIARRYELALERTTDDRIKAKSLQDGERTLLVVFNYSGEEVTATLQVDGLEASGGFTVERIEPPGPPPESSAVPEGLWLTISLSARSVALYLLSPSAR